VLLASSIGAEAAGVLGVVLAWCEEGACGFVVPYAVDLMTGCFWLASASASSPSVFLPVYTELYYECNVGMCANKMMLQAVVVAGPYRTDCIVEWMVCAAPQRCVQVWYRLTCTWPSQDVVL